MKIFGKKDKNQKNNIATAVEDNSPVYQLPYFMDDNSKKNTKKDSDKKTSGNQTPTIKVDPELSKDNEATKKANASGKKPVAKASISTEKSKSNAEKSSKPTKSSDKTTAKSKNDTIKVKNDVQTAEKKVATKKAPLKNDTHAKTAGDKPKAKKSAVSDDKKSVEGVAKSKTPTETKEKSSSKSTANKSVTNAPTEEKAETKKQAEKNATSKIGVTKADSLLKVEPDTENEQKLTKIGKFEIKKSKDGRYVFNLYASNGVIVATSQIYSSSSSAMTGIKSVIANAASSPIEDQTLKNVTTLPYPKWEIYRDKGEQYRFRLSASNGSCVCHSQGYTTKTNCKKGIESIMKLAADADITKAYLDKKEK